MKQKLTHWNWKNKQAEEKAQERETHLFPHLGIP